MRHLALLCISFFLIISSSEAQTGLIRGTVSDATTGESLIQAAVLYSGQGVLTDFDGRYKVELLPGVYELSVSYVGYEPMKKEVELQAGETIVVDFKLQTVLLQIAEVVTDIAIERETPVAFSNIKPLQIQEELGSQPIPMILNSTPGVYATQAGSDDNGPSISIRGFKQRNVSVLIDGIPVNDMENGGVYWNNWFGLDLVTQTMQVQRGLGASKLALPAIGGTVNIITQGIENKKKTSVKQEVGSFGTTRTTIGHTSGRLDNGWGYTFSTSFRNGGGFPDQSYTKSYFYYLKVQKELGTRLLSVSLTGSPSENSARGYQQRIATHDKEFARSLFNGSDADYANMVDYSQAYTDIFNDGTLSIYEEGNLFAELNNEHGYSVDTININPNSEYRYGRVRLSGNAADYENQMTETNFIDTTGLVDFGNRYNVHWGDLNDGVLYERQNKYHKPLATIRLSNRISEDLYVSTSLYTSYGHGGGTRLENALGSGDYTEDGQVDFQGFYNTNTIGGLFGPPIDPTYSDSLLKSSRILRKLYNNHYWFGALSTFRYSHPNEKLTISGGIDLRTYRAEHYSTVHNLLGGDYYVDVNDPNDSEPMHFVGDTIGYHNDSFVRWAGMFGLAEYKGPFYNCFFNVSTVTQSYRRMDYFRDQDSQSSETIKIPGYTVKTGGNINVTEWLDVFMNAGYLNRTPVFNNVIGYDNQIVENIKNEKIRSMEWGAKWSKNPFTFNLNGYVTDWQNRPLQNLLRIETPSGEIARANINSMSARHQGIEFDFAYQINRELTFDGYASFGDWRWTSSEDSLQLIDDETLLPYLNEQGDPVVISYNAEGVSVGDAPQTQIGFSIRYRKNGFYIKPRYTFFDRFYADFDPFSLYDENEGRQSWEMPAYGLMDLHAGYTMDFKDAQIDYRFSIFNVLNTTYLINAQNNDAYGEWYFAQSNRTYAFTENNFDAASASVYMGYGLRTNFSIRVRF